jgi:translation initiation factor RLI1
MAGKIALIDYRKCDPQLCAEGVCIAAQACPRKLIGQEAPYEAPMTDPAPCRGCGDCARTCTQGAIQIASG